MQIFAGVPRGFTIILSIASIDNRVVDDDIFGYFFGNFGDKDNIIIWR